MSEAVTPWTIYPKRYFNASPTWFKWNSLTIADVHALRSEPAFEGQRVYFHLNHPIQFVRLVGVVVDILITAGKYLLLSIDDGSGACLEIKTILRADKDREDAEHPSNTFTDSLNVYSVLGRTRVVVDDRQLDIGTVVKAKGTIDTFRDTRQLRLERIWILEHTGEEVKAWSETARWRQHVLSHPWIMSREQRIEIDERIRLENLEQQARAKKKRLHDARDTERKTRRAEKMERRRTRMEIIYNAGALPGSNALPNRLTDS